jgi:hypothetical protein
VPPLQYYDAHQHRIFYENLYDDEYNHTSYD